MLDRSRRSAPWKPRVLAAANSDATQGSSPGLSTIRPQRGSRATSTIGANVRLTPSAAASAARAPCGLPPHVRIEQTRLRERYREDRAVTVDDIHADEQRNAQARLLHGEALQSVHRSAPPYVEHVADTSAADSLFQI